MSFLHSTCSLNREVNWASPGTFSAESAMPLVSLPRRLEQYSRYDLNTLDILQMIALEWQEQHSQSKGLSRVSIARCVICRFMPVKKLA